MSKFSRDKGKRFEQALARELRYHGYDAHRSAQYCGRSGDAADVIGLPGVHIEAKHQEKMKLYDWMDQAVRDASGTGCMPVVIHKQNYKDILVTMRLEDWMKIYREWEAGNDTER